MLLLPAISISVLSLFPDWPNCILSCCLIVLSCSILYWLFLTMISRWLCCIESPPTDLSLIELESEKVVPSLPLMLFGFGTYWLILMTLELRSCCSWFCDWHSAITSARLMTLSPLVLSYMLLLF